METFHIQHGSNTKNRLGHFYETTENLVLGSTFWKLPFTICLPHSQYPSEGMSLTPLGFFQIGMPDHCLCKAN